MFRYPFTKVSCRVVLLVAYGMTIAAASAFAGEDVEKARRYLETGQYEAAVIELKNVLQQDPGDASARLLLGDLYLRLKNGAGAEKELLRAEKLGADPAAWRLKLIEAMLLERKFSEALDRLDGFGSLPKQEESLAQALRGQANLGLGKYEDAAGNFDQAIALDAHNQAAYLGRIQLSLAKGDLEEATKEVDELLSRSPDNVDALLVRAELHRNKREMTEAAKRYDQVLKLEPENIAALLGRITTMIAADDLSGAKSELDHVDQISKDLVMTHYLRGLVDFKQRDWDQARLSLQKVLLSIPNHLQSQLLLGIISYSGGELQIAEEYLGNVVGAMPDNALAVKILGATYLKLREPKKAIAVIEPLVQRTPDAQSMALLGSAYMIDGDQERGQEWLGRAVEAAPDVASLRTKLGLTLLAAGETEKAITELQSAVDLGQDVLQADVFLVLAHLKNHEIDKALEASEALVRRMPDSAIAYNLTGLALLTKGDKEKARERFHKALELDPAFATAAMNLARIDFSEGNPDAARKWLQSILDKRPTHLGAMLGMATVAEQNKDIVGMVSWLEKAQEANPEAAQPGLLLAKHYLSAKESSKALSFTEDLARRFPDNVQVLSLLGQAQSLAGDTRGSIHTLEEMARLRPQDAQLQYALGRAKLGGEDLAGARDALGKAISLKPDFVDAREMLGTLEIQDGHTGDALSVAGRLQQDAPDAAVGYRLEGKAYLAEDEPRKALQALSMAYAKEKSGEIVRLLAYAHAQTGERAKAIDLLDDWMKGHPEDTGVLGMLAMYYQAEGRNGDATKAYETLASRNPEDVVVLNNLAWLYQAAGNPRAVEIAKKAYDLNPDKPEIADTYGWILVQSGNVQEGLPILQQAYVSLPTQTEIGYHLVVGLGRADRKDEAVKVGQRLLRENPSFPQAGDLKALLEELEKSGY